MRANARLEETCSVAKEPLCETEKGKGRVQLGGIPLLSTSTMKDGGSHDYVAQLHKLLLWGFL